MCANCFSYISLDTQAICLVCNRGSLDGFTHPGCKGTYVIDGAFSSLIYKGVVKKLLYYFKYKPYVSDLQTVLSDFFYEGLIQNEGFQKALEKNPVFVPIPLHSSKLKSRGYNQADILAKDLSQKFNVPVLHFLERIKKTPSQVGLKREERLKNIKNAFIVKSDKKQEIREKYIFLVDDVLTTGATLSEAAYVLKKNGAKKVWGITLAQD